MTKETVANSLIEVCAHMDGVREYAEGYAVDLMRDPDAGRLVIRATNEGGHNVTHVDLLDLLGWLRMRYPNLLGGEGNEEIHRIRTDGN